MWVSGMTLGYVRHKEFSMKKSKLWLGALAATLVFAMTAAGCDDGGGGLETLPGDVTISPSADVSTGTDSNTYVVQTADIDGDDYRNRFPRRLYGQCYQRAHARYHRSSSLNAGAGFYTDKQQYGLFGCQRHGKRRRSDHTGCV